MSEFESLGIKLNKSNLTLDEIDKRAKELGMNRSQFTTMALQMMVNFDLNVWNQIDKYSKGLDVPCWMVIQNMLIKRFAMEAAAAEVWGPHSKLLDEFMKETSEDGPKDITGNELFGMLKKMYVDDEEKEKIKLFLEEETYDLLDDEQKEFLIKRRVGKAWLESDEYKAEMETKRRLKEKYPDLYKDNDNIGELISE